MIRSCRQQDVARITDIAKTAWAPIYDAYAKEHGEELFRTLMPDALERKGQAVAAFCREHPDRVYVWEEQGQVAAFLTFRVNPDPGIGTILNNAVAPAFQGKGIGPRLYREVIRHFRSLNLKYAKVSTGADAAHAPARKAYKKAGFDIEWKHVDYYRKL